LRAGTVQARRKPGNKGTQNEGLESRERKGQEAKYYRESGREDTSSGLWNP
jgi:hypothetical protein